MQGFKKQNSENNNFQKNLYLDSIQIEILRYLFEVISVTASSIFTVNKRLIILEDFHVDISLGICLDIDEQ